LVALGAVGTAAEKWVILSDNGPLAEFLGEGTTIQAAWANAAKNLRLIVEGVGR
jgi:hypothetical protein